MGCGLPGFKIEPLGEHHSREAFSCGNDTIDKFIQGRALKDHRDYKVRVQVARCSDREIIAEFYSLSLKGLAAKEIKGKIGNKFGSWPIPAVYLSMIGTASDLQGHGVGKDLMLHAFRATLAIADMAGTACLTLDAVDEDKALWYEARSFRRFTPGKLGMYIPLATVRAACEAADVDEVPDASD